MAQCPYPETFTDRTSGNTELNNLYLAWHEGYEAQKLEMIAKVKFLEMRIKEVYAEIREIKELKRDLEKQRTKF